MKVRWYSWIPAHSLCWCKETTTAPFLAIPPWLSTTWNITASSCGWSLRVNLTCFRTQTGVQLVFLGGLFCIFFGFFFHGYAKVQLLRLHNLLSFPWGPSDLSDFCTMKLWPRIYYFFSLLQIQGALNLPAEKWKIPGFSFLQIFMILMIH